MGISTRCSWRPFSNMHFSMISIGSVHHLIAINSCHTMLRNVIQKELPTKFAWQKKSHHSIPSWMVVTADIVFRMTTSCHTACCIPLNVHYVHLWIPSAKLLSSLITIWPTYHSRGDAGGPRGGSIITLLTLVLTLPNATYRLFISCWINYSEVIAFL